MTCNTIDNDITMSGGSGMLLAGRYRIVRQLGQGGMGSVWLAEDTLLDNKQFAIKMLPSILVSNKRAYRQLKDEALVAMKLVHPNIVQLRAFEENNGNPFLVMDYIDGQTLDDYLAEKGKLSENETIRLLKPIAAALDYAHSKGVVHRDVKPGNVMIAKDGTSYILDFGIAREIQETMTRVTGTLSSGTLLYMSPEQLNGAIPQPAQDVYSFSVVVYECLKGDPPFCRGQVDRQILENSPDPLPDGVADLRLAASIMSGLAKDPAQRPSSCVGLLLWRPPTFARSVSQKNKSDVEQVKSRVEARCLQPMSLVPHLRRKAYSFIVVGVMLTVICGAACAYLARHKGKNKASEPDVKPHIAMSEDKYEEAKSLFLSGSHREIINRYGEGAVKEFPDLAYLFGLIYEYGLSDVRRDSLMAKHWFEIGSNGNSAMARVGLGTLYCAGVGDVIEENVEEGERLVRGGIDVVARNAESGDPIAQGLYGRLLLNGIGCATNVEAAVKYMEKSANSGNCIACMEMARIYLLESGVEDNETTAFKWLTKAYDHGMVAASYEIGNYWTRRGNAGEGKKWYLNCRDYILAGAREGSVALQRVAGRFYQKGVWGGTNITEAVKWFEAAGNKGDRDSQTALAVLYFKEGNNEKGYKWSEKAALQGDLEAAKYAAAGCMRRQEYEKAAKFLRMAPLDEMCGGNYTNLGIINDLETNYVEAVEWYQRGADVKDPNATRLLAGMYYKGKGVGKDVPKAIELYEKAVELKCAGAALQLGQIYAEEAKKDILATDAQPYKKAKKLFLQAQELADGKDKIAKLAKDSLDELEAPNLPFGQLTPIVRLVPIEKGAKGKMDVPRVKSSCSKKDVAVSTDNGGMLVAKADSPSDLLGAEIVAETETLEGKIVIDEKTIRLSQRGLVALYMAQRPPPKLCVKATVNGEEVRAKIFNRNETWQTPVVWSLKRGEMYGPYKIAHEDSGGCIYTGVMNRITADWRGEKQLRIQLNEERRPALPRKPKHGQVATLTLPGGAKMEMIFCDQAGWGRGFWLGKYEVTQREWKSVMNDNPSYHKGNDNKPVDCLSLDDCRAFVRKINDALKCNARLPTEREWRYACNAGASGFVGNLDAVAWHSDNSGGTTHVVGTKRENGWGFYDMRGNVWEWCEDGVACGGGYGSTPKCSYIAGTFDFMGGRGSVNCGFRLCCSAGPRE